MSSQERKMRVSFDLDEVLFVSPKTHKTEPALPFPLRNLFPERLRLGTPELIRELQIQGYEVWIYTSSFRSESYIRRLFRCYGVRFDGIINTPRHLKEVQKSRRTPLPQKMPGFYHIALHIDDEDVIHQHGKRYGFRTYKVCEPDPDWVEKVLAEARRVRDLPSVRK